MTTYVLSRDQVSRAIVAGAIKLGLIPETETSSTPAVKHAANGVILDMVLTPASADVAAPEGIKKGSAKPATTPVKTSLPAAPAANNGASSKTSPENVKAALVAAGMDSPPGVNTIKGWNEKQLKDALKWAKNPTTERPAFIVPRKKKGEGSTQTVASPDATANLPPLQGAAAHFEADD